MRVAAVMIVKNEEEMLPRCLESIKDFDEIIICDTGSTDKTVEIAKKYTDKVFTDYKWEDSFCKARNHALTKVSKDIDWILTIDADEYLLNTFQEVKDEIAKGNAIVLYINVNSEDFTEVMTSPRIHKNTPEIFWLHDAHNILNVTSRENLNLTIVCGYSPAHKKDPDRTLRILENTLKKGSASPRDKYYLAREYYYRNQWQKAIEMVDEYARESKFLAERNEALLMKAYCLTALGQHEAACDSAWEALKRNANFEEALRFIGDHVTSPVNKARWHSFADLADNTDVLFIRTLKNTKIVYYSRGMTHFGEKMVKHMGYRQYNPISDINGDVFFQGLYFQEDYDTFVNHKGKRTLYWNGSDVLSMIENPQWKKIIQTTPAKHYCQTGWMVEVLRRIGVKAEYKPIYFGNLSKYNILYKHSEKPQVYMTSHPDRDEEYGVNILKSVAKKLPDFTFHVYGNTGENTENFIYHGLVDEEVMDNEIKDFQATFKGPINGISQTMIKALVMGQYAISYSPLEGVWCADSEDSLIEQLQKLKTQRKPNLKGREFILNGPIGKPMSL